MVKKISEIYGKPIYSREGKMLGTVNDVILNIEKGKAVRLVTRELSNVSREGLRTIMKEESIDYGRVKSIGDIILLGKKRVNKDKREKKKKAPGILNK
ncbi:MAG: PRC-barrel domain-containing protein [archaeon]